MTVELALLFVCFFLPQTFSSIPLSHLFHVCSCARQKAQALVTDEVPSLTAWQWLFRAVFSVYSLSQGTTAYHLRIFPTVFHLPTTWYRKNFSLCSPKAEVQIRGGRVGRNSSARMSLSACIQKARGKTRRKGSGTDHPCVRASCSSTGPSWPLSFPVGRERGEGNSVLCLTSLRSGEMGGTETPAESERITWKVLLPDWE